MKNKPAKNPALLSPVTGGILCGTDFSRAADVAVDVATEMASRLGAPLSFAHALELPHALKGEAKAVRWLTGIRKRRLRKIAESRRKRGVAVRESVTVGRADEVLVRMAAAENARMIVVSSLGDRRPGKWLLGSVAERTAANAGAPVLVLRNADSLRSWLHGKRSLKIFVCYNHTASADAALAWTRSLMAIGPCEVVLGYINSPIDDYVRIGAPGRLPFDGNPPEVLAILERDMRARARAQLGSEPARCRIEDHLGRTEARLAEMAKEEGADLIVAGSRQHRGFRRLWNSSVSRGLLGRSTMSVAIVPLAAAKGIPSQVPSLRHVLVATDFSDAGNAAIPHAYSLVRGGGIVTLLHVITTPPDAGLANRPATAVRRRAEEGAKTGKTPAIAAQLRKLVPPDAAGLGVHTQVKVASNPRVGVGIAQVAERLGVDVVCFASRRRSGLTKLLLGSVAEEVITRVRRPVFVVRPLTG